MKDYSLRYVLRSYATDRADRLGLEEPQSKL